MTDDEYHARHEAGLAVWGSWRNVWLRDGWFTGDRYNRQRHGASYIAGLPGGDIEDDDLEMAEKAEAIIAEALANDTAEHGDPEVQRISPFVWSERYLRSVLEAKARGEA